MKRYKDTPCIPCPHTYRTFPLAIFSISVVHVFTVEEPILHIMVTPSPEFTLGLTLGLVHSMGINKYIITCIHHYNVRQSSFVALKILCVPPIHPSPNASHPLTLLLSPLFGLSFFFWRKFPFFPPLSPFNFTRMSHSWSHTVCNLPRLALFT